MATFHGYHQAPWWWWTLYLIFASRISGKKGLTREREFQELLESIIGESASEVVPRRRRRARVVSNG